jgi:hypothetical protein
MDMSQFYAPANQAAQDTVASNQQLETALFGGPIDQMAPQLSSLVDPNSLSDSSQAGNTDYSFYSDPSSYLNNADYSPTDVTTPFYNDTQTTNLATLDPSYYDY